MSSGTDGEDCDGAAEIVPGIWVSCLRYYHGREGDHIVPVIDGKQITWPAAEGDHRRDDGRIYIGRQAERIRRAWSDLREWENNYPADISELVNDAQRRLRDAYKLLTGREPK